jgi:dienelactone hydrolase
VPDPARRLALWLAVAALPACGASDDGARDVGGPSVVAPDVACSAFVISGDPRTAGGARWTYRSTDAGITYDLEGVLLAPEGRGPFPAVIVSHGRGGSPANYSARVGRTMVTWGLVVIAPGYTHAGTASTGLPAGGEGASAANVARARKARQLLSCLGYVDLTRVAAHGHSMGAFVTGELLGTHPSEFRVASHTAGGASPLPTAVATHTTTAERIVTPYQLHHGDADTVVALAADQELDRILTRNGVVHELRVYRGYDHDDVAFDPGILQAIRAWYTAHGLLP